MRTGRPKTSVDIVKTCRSCGNEFTVKAWEDQRIYCSRKCWHPAVIKQCERCGKDFRVNPRRASDAKYCSAVCYRAQRQDRDDPRNTKTDLVCPGCGKTFELSRSKVEGGQKCCSLKCRMDVWRRAPRRARDMADVEAAWLAGLFDGEGTIAVADRSRTDGMHGYRIGIANTSKPLMDRIVQVTGLDNIYLTKRSEKNPNHQDCYYWQVAGLEALHILKQMRPWLIVKAERADLAFEGKNFPRIRKFDGKPVAQGRTKRRRPLVLDPVT